MANKRAVSVDDILKKKFKELLLTGDWKKMLGIPQASGVWIIWGQSGSGKSRFLMLMAYMLSQFGKVAFNALEEGARRTLQKNIIECNMIAVAKNFYVLNRESIDELKVRLRKKKHPTVVFIDSLQYASLTKKQYLDLKEEFGDKVLFIFNSHADGKEPQGSLAKFVRYDADIKIRVEGFKAFPVSRYGGGEPFVIWPEEAAKYWMDLV